MVHYCPAEVLENGQLSAAAASGRKPFNELKITEK
jgi:hypothetical protein